ncbi:MAG: hypothetical protein ACYC9O_00660 [Candidatus Latescibacterota bacterium]
MNEVVVSIIGHQAIIHVGDRICTSARDLLRSPVFSEMVHRYCDSLMERESPLWRPFLRTGGAPLGVDQAVDLLRVLSGIPLEQAVVMLPWAAHFITPENRRTLHDFVEGFYNHWRGFDRYMVLHSEPGPSGFDRRPYRSFNTTMENLTHIVRALYRDICENITGDCPRVYRQVSAG